MSAASNQTTLQQVVCLNSTFPLLVGFKVQLYKTANVCGQTHLLCKLLYFDLSQSTHLANFYSILSTCKMSKTTLFYSHRLI